MLTTAQEADAGRLKRILTKPEWIRRADWAATSCVVLGACTVVSSGVRLRFGSVRLQWDSPWPLLGAALALVVLRHAILSRPTILNTWRESLLSLASPEWRAAFAVGSSSRIAIWCVAWLAVAFSADTPGVRLRSAEGEPIRIEDVFLKWDGGWYVFTAAHGYRWERRADRMQNVAFFPAYPMLVRTVGALTGSRVLFTDARENTSREFRLTQEARLTYVGLLVSLTAFVWALRNLYELARRFDEHSAARAVLLAAWYPFAVFYGAIYTESLFLLGLTGTWLAVERRAWAHATAWGFLVGLTRPVGFLISAAVAIAAWKQRGQAQRSYLQIPAVLAPAAGAGLFSLYLYSLTGNPLEWIHSQAAWNRFNPDLSPLVVAAERAQFIWSHGLLEYIARWPSEFMNAVPALACLVLAIPIARRLGLQYGVLALLLIGPALFAGGFMTTGRFTAPIFPVYLYLAQANPPGLCRLLVPIFAAFQALVAAMHFVGKPIY